MRWIEDVWKETSEGRLGGEFGENVRSAGLHGLFSQASTSIPRFLFGTSVFACPHVFL